jgi:hypothetical protein
VTGEAVRDGTVFGRALADTERWGLVVDVPVPALVFDVLPSDLTRRVLPLVPLLFTQGINEAQTVINAIGSDQVALQRDVNLNSLQKLLHYARQWGYVAVGANARKLERDMGALAETVRLESASPGKHPRILTLAAEIVRALHGGRITCCKSGKDRTAMSVTFEEARLLQQRHGLPAHRVPEVAALLRAHGVRLDVCAKNAGYPLYAFNNLQLSMLPRAYRPPPFTIAGGEHRGEDGAKVRVEA